MRRQVEGGRQIQLTNAPAMLKTLQQGDIETRLPDLEAVEVAKARNLAPRCTTMIPRRRCQRSTRG